MRRRGSGAPLILLASILLLIGLVCAYAQAVLFDSRAFADRSLGALDDPALQEEISGRLAPELARIGVDPASAETTPAAVTSGLIENRGFRAAFSAAVAAAHRTILTRDTDQADVTVRNIDDPLRTQLEGVSPGLGAGVPDGLDLPLGGTSGVARALDVARMIDSATAVGVLLGLAGLGLIGIAVWRADDRLAAGRNAFIGVALSGLCVAGIYVAGRLMVGAAVDGSETAEIGRAVYGAVAGNLLWLGLLVAGAGGLGAAGLGILKPRA